MNDKRPLLLIGACTSALISASGLHNALSAPMGSAASDKGMSTFFVFAIVCIVLSIIFSRQKVASPKQKDDPSKLTVAETRAASIERVGAVTELPVVEEPFSIILRAGEICHGQFEASVWTVKNQVVGYKSDSSGASVRIAKGLTIRSGGSRSTPIRQDVATVYPGLFSVTNQRFIMTGEKGFEYPLGKLTSLTPYNRYEGITLQFGRTSYTLLMDEPYWIPKLIDLLSEAQMREMGLPQTTDQSKTLSYKTAEEKEDA